MCLVLGGSTTLAFAPFDHWALIFPALIAFLVLLAKYSKYPFLDAWLFGFGYFGVGISWVHVSIATFGGLPLIIGLLLMALLCGYLALYFGIALWCLKRFFKPYLWPLAGPLIWLICEYGRATFLSGFPWLSLGYSQLDSPLSALFPVIGEIGISALMIGLCLALTAIIIERQRALKTTIGYLATTSVVLLIVSSINWVDNTGKSVSVAMVQGNIEQSMRWRPELDRPTIDKYVRLSEAHWQADLVVWPEAAIPVLESFPLANETLVTLDATAEQHQTALVTGVVDYQRDIDENGVLIEESYNFIVSLGIDENGKNTEPYYYRHNNRFAKHQLVPIGEFVPFESILRPLAPLFDLPMSSFNRGDFVQPNLLANDLRLVPALCYEVAFPNQMRANVAKASDILLTVSNDAWFGDSHGPHQHLQIARARAMEFGLPIIRATNTGITAAYDANGNLLGKLPQFVEGVLEVDIPLVDGSTPYVSLGNLPIYIIAIPLFIFAIIAQRREATESENQKRNVNI
ncbi:MAG: apolipoprotein N-acyltransferase [Pseudomonadota bacterium]